MESRSLPEMIQLWPALNFAIDAAQKTYLPSIFDRASRLRLAQPSFST